jgi:hypothetical protein
MRGQYSEMAEYGLPDCQGSSGRLQTAAMYNQIRVLSVIYGGLAMHSSSFYGIGKSTIEL